MLGFEPKRVKKSDLLIDCQEFVRAQHFKERLSERLLVYIVVVLLEKVEDDLQLGAIITGVTPGHMPQFVVINVDVFIEVVLEVDLDAIVLLVVKPFTFQRPAADPSPIFSL